MAWIQDSTKALDIRIGDGVTPPVDDKLKRIIIAVIIIVIAYFLLKETGKTGK